jgi:nucleoside-diphosphate-sugar epimerase
MNIISSPKNKKNKVFLVGSTGFVGMHLAAELKRRAVPFKATIRTKEQNFDNEIEFVITGNLVEGVNWRGHMNDVSTVIYAAARAHITKEIHGDGMSNYEAINAEAALHCANMAAVSGVKRFIYISSIKVNGESTNFNKPYSFDQPPQPEDPYALSKLSAEKQLLRLGAEKKIEVVIIRPPLIYGPNVKANFLHMMQLISLRVPLPFDLARDNKRSFVSIDNLADLIITCISHPKAANDIFLVSDGHDISTADLLTTLGLIMGVKVRLFAFPKVLVEAIFFILGRHGMARRLFGSLQVDISHTQEKLDWKPPLSMEEGLKTAVYTFLQRGVKNEKNNRLNA